MMRAMPTVVSATSAHYRYRYYYYPPSPPQGVGRLRT